MVSWGPQRFSGPVATREVAGCFPLNKLEGIAPMTECSGARATARAALACVLASLAACSPPSTVSRPVSADVAGPERELEPPNSLPRGFTTQNPIAPSTGIVGTTRVGR